MRVPQVHNPPSPPDIATDHLSVQESTDKIRRIFVDVQRRGRHGRQDAAIERTLHHRPEEGDMKGMMDLKVLWKMEGVRYLSHPPQDLKRPYIPGC